MKLRKIRYTGAILIACLLTMAASCNKYQKVGELAKDAAATSLVAQETEIALFQQGKINPLTHQIIQTKFLQLADAGQRLDKAINETHSAKDATAALQAAIAAVDDLTQNGISGIKDDQTRADVKLAFVAVKTILDNISAFSQ